jgi:hypothetical protein
MNVFTSIFTILYYLLIPLVLTICIELGIWKLISIFSKQFDLKYAWLAVIAVNIATNPAFNILSSLIDPTRKLYLLELSLELIIIFVEAGIFYIIYKKYFGKLLLLSAAINIVSYGIGLLIFPPTWL